MTPSAIVQKAIADGVKLWLSPAGTIKVAGNGPAVERWLPVIRERKPEIMAALAKESFDFSAPADPEAIEERACIIAEACRMDYVRALQEARWQAEREASWCAFRRNADRILNAPEGQQGVLLQRYDSEAAARYGTSMAAAMAETMRKWIAGKSGARPERPTREVA